MLNLVWANLTTFAAALLIGVATARWAFPKPPPTEPASKDAE